jgi:hypothetical protein
VNQIVPLLAILAPTLAVVASWLLTRKAAKKNESAVQEIHVMVNSQLSEALDRVAALEARFGVGSDEPV